MLDERIVGRAGVHAYDPTRLVVDVRGLGATGHRVARIMREQDDINLELFSENVVVAVFGIGEHAERTGERLVEGLEHAAERIGEEGEEPLPPFAEPPPWGPTELSPREAFLAGQEVVGVRRGRGQDRCRVAGRLPAGRPERAPGRAADPADAGLHRRQRRPRRPRPGRERPDPEHDPRRGRMNEQRATSNEQPAWGADSEYGHLRHVLLGPPDNFRWLPTSAISKATLASGAAFDRELALSQHRELVSVYESAGVTVHRLEPDPALPYQVFARDSSVMTPRGPVVTQLKQRWRRGEYAPVIRFYEAAGIEVWRMATAGAIEGGDVTIVEPGTLLIGNGEERTEIEAARQLAGWMRDEGWEVRIEPIPDSSSTSTSWSRSWRRSWRPYASSRRPAASSPGCGRRASSSSRSRPPTPSSSASTRSRWAASG